MRDLCTVIVWTLYLAIWRTWAESEGRKSPLRSNPAHFHLPPSSPFFGADRCSMVSLPTTSRVCASPSPIHFYIPPHLHPTPLHSSTISLSQATEIADEDSFHLDTPPRAALSKRYGSLEQAIDVGREKMATPPLFVSLKSPIYIYTRRLNWFKIHIKLNWIHVNVQIRFGSWVR